MHFDAPTFAVPKNHTTDRNGPQNHLALSSFVGGSVTLAVVVAHWRYCSSTSTTLSDSQNPLFLQCSETFSAFTWNVRTSRRPYGHTPTYPVVVKHRINNNNNRMGWDLRFSSVNCLNHFHHHASCNKTIILRTSLKRLAATNFGSCNLLLCSGSR